MPSRARSISDVALTLATLATAVSVAVASPAPHKHRHLHIGKRSIEVVNVPGPTLITYELNGHLIDQSEVCDGIKAGNLKWADGTGTPPVCPEQGSYLLQTTSSQPAPPTTAESSSVAPVTLSTPPNSGATEVASATPTTTSSPVTLNDIVKEAVVVKTSQTFTTPTSSTTAAPNSGETSSSTVDSGITPGGQTLDTEFPDGEIDCTTFPSEYGPIEIEWANLGGWSGIQYVTIEGNEVTHIDTAVPGGDGCKPGAMCSYACPPGYQKSQWPSAQGSTGQSVGGLSCNSDGKLALTNPKLSKNLCIQGTGAVEVQSKLSNNAAICRTDYPGTEDETVPLNVEPASTSPLTCPDASTYFVWNGDPTTAQYYVNNQGVALQSACTWGTDGSDMGNWAPSYFGVGQDVNGKTWLSIASTVQNNPSSYTPLNYTVKITGDISGNCGVSDGQYCSGDNYSDCNTQGCTVELLSGQATYVLEDGSSLSK